MFGWLQDGRKVLAAAIIFATIIFSWMFRFETIDFGAHRNRITGAYCPIAVECWLKE
jgi:hypothetical protein